MSRVSAPIFPDRKRGPREAIHCWGQQGYSKKSTCPRAALFPSHTHLFNLRRALEGRQVPRPPLQMSPKSLTPSHHADQGGRSSTPGWDSWASAPSSTLGGCSLSNASCGFQFTTSHFRSRRENKGTERLSDEPKDTQVRSHRAKTRGWAF